MLAPQLSLITLLATTAVISGAAPASASVASSALEARIAAIRQGAWGEVLGGRPLVASPDTTLARAWGNGGGRAWGNGGRRFYGGRGWGNGSGQGWLNGGRRWGNGGGAWGNGGGRGFVNW